MTSLVGPLRIGSVTLPNNLVLSPMAGFSDLPFRVLCRRHGAGLVCSEMVAAAGAGREVDHPTRRSRTTLAERPTSIQLFGTEPETVAHAARTFEDACDVLGFNMGCPAPQIRHAGCGAALLDRPERCEALVRAIKDASRRPLLVKIRAGNQGPMDVVAFARRLEAAGADGLIFHARTARQGYSGRADWELIRAVKHAVAVPIVGNGDISDPRSAEAALRSSGADGLAIGRAALGNPRLFGQIASYLSTGRLPAPTSPEEKARDFLDYLEMALDLGFDRPRILQQAHRFSRGLPNAAELRLRLHDGRASTDRLRAEFESLAAA